MRTKKREAVTGGARRKRLAAAQSRKSAQGATRKAPAAAAPREPSAWLNRLIILTGAGVVMVAALQAFITLQAIPVQRITVTGELEHTRTSVVQDLIQPALVGGLSGGRPATYPRTVGSIALDIPGHGSAPLAQCTGNSRSRAVTHRALGRKRFPEPRGRGIPVGQQPGVAGSAAFTGPAGECKGDGGGLPAHR